MSFRICGEQRGEELAKIIDEMKSETVRVSDREQYLEVLTRWAEDTGDRIIGTQLMCLI